MTYGMYHCDKCRADHNPYIRVGDEIRFWSRSLQMHVQGKVVAITDYQNPWGAKTYTVDHNGVRISVNHGPDNPVTLISRPGLPVTYEQHMAYINEHQITAPNILADWKLYLRIRDARKNRVLGGAS